MTRRLSILALVAFCIAFWAFIFYVLPWYLALGTLLCMTTLMGILAYSEIHVELEEPSGEEMRDMPDLWDFPDRCVEAPDPFREAA